MRHTYQCSVRWGDMDALGHVNNVRYLDYLQEARIDMFWTAPQRDGHSLMEFDLIVARNEIDYLAPLVWSHQPISMEVWVTKIGTTSFEVAYELKQGDVIHARAKSVLVQYDLESRTARPVSELERSLLERYFDQ